MNTAGPTFTSSGRAAAIGLMAVGGSVSLAIVANLALQDAGSTNGWLLVGVAIAVLCSTAALTTRVIVRRSPTRSVQDAAIRRIKTRVSQSLAIIASPPFPIEIENHPRRSITNPRTLSVEEFHLNFFDAEDKSTVLLGPLGAGKSVIASRLLVTICGRWQDEAAYDPPIYVRGRDFGHSENFRSAIERCMKAALGVEPSVSSRWFGSGQAILVVDGIEETPENKRQLVLAGLKRWVASNRRSLVTCRSDVDTEWLDQINFDASATVLQLSNSFLAEIVQEYPAPAQLMYLVEHESDGRLINWRRPLFTSLLALEHSQSLRSEERGGLAALGLGDQSLRSTDLSAARRAYQLAAREEGSYVRGSALVRLSYLSAAQGDVEGAHSALRLAADLRMDSGPDAEREVARESSERERKVLACLVPGVGYDSPRITILSGLPPSEVLEVLNELVDEGLLIESTSFEETVYTFIAGPGMPAHD